MADLVVWDNRCAMHRRDSFDGNERRVMHRAQCAGDRPSHDAVRSRTHPHPRASEASTNHVQVEAGTREGSAVRHSIVAPTSTLR